MNTLSKAITATFFVNESGYQEIERIWKENLRNGGKPTAGQHLAYMILRGKNWRKAFTPITNTKKLANGAMPYNWGLYKAWYNLSFALFTPLLVEDIHKRVKQLIPEDAHLTEGEAYKDEAKELASVAG